MGISDKFDNSTVIKSISDNQHEIISNIGQLYLDNKPFDVDITYSKGNFYGTHGDYYIPQPKHKFDVLPQQDDVKKLDKWGTLPFEDSSINSFMFDPPFVITGRLSDRVKKNRNSCKNVKRFHGYYKIEELLDSYYHWLSEMARCTKENGIIVCKTQRNVTGRLQLNSPEWLWLCGESLGLYMVDLFCLTARNRLIGKMRKQHHSRRFESEFLVFKKTTVRKVRYFDFASNDTIEYIINGFVENNRYISNRKIKYKR